MIDCCKNQEVKTYTGQIDRSRFVMREIPIYFCASCGQIFFPDNLERVNNPTRDEFKVNYKLHIVKEKKCDC